MSINTQQEKNFFEYRGKISQPKRDEVITIPEDVLNKIEENRIPKDLPSFPSDLLKKVDILDDIADKIINTINEKNKDFRLPVDVVKFPDVSRAINGLKGNVADTGEIINDEEEITWDIVNEVLDSEIELPIDPFEVVLGKDAENMDLVTTLIGKLSSGEITEINEDIDKLIQDLENEDVPEETNEPVPTPEETKNAIMNDLISTGYGPSSVAEMQDLLTRIRDNNRLNNQIDQEYKEFKLKMIDWFILLFIQVSKKLVLQYMLKMAPVMEAKGLATTMIGMGMSLAIKLVQRVFKYMEERMREYMGKKIGQPIPKQYDQRFEKVLNVESNQSYMHQLNCKTINSHLSSGLRTPSSANTYLDYRKLKDAKSLKQEADHYRRLLFGYDPNKMLKEDGQIFVKNDNKDFLENLQMSEDNYNIYLDKQNLNQQQNLLEKNKKELDDLIIQNSNKSNTLFNTSSLDNKIQTQLGKDKLDPNGNLISSSTLTTIPVGVTGVIGTGIETSVGVLQGGISRATTDILGFSQEEKLESQREIVNAQNSIVQLSKELSEGKITKEQYENASRRYNNIIKHHESIVHSNALGRINFVSNEWLNNQKKIINDINSQREQRIDTFNERNDYLDIMRAKTRDKSAELADPEIIQQRISQNNTTIVELKKENEKLQNDPDKQKQFEENQKIINDLEKRNKEEQERYKSIEKNGSVTNTLNRATETVVNHIDQVAIAGDILLNHIETGINIALDYAMGTLSLIVGKDEQTQICCLIRFLTKQGYTTQEDINKWADKNIKKLKKIRALLNFALGYKFKIYDETDNIIIGMLNTFRGFIRNIIIKLLDRVWKELTEEINKWLSDGIMPEIMQCTSLSGIITYLIDAINAIRNKLVDEINKALKNQKYKEAILLKDLQNSYEIKRVKDYIDIVDRLIRYLSMAKLCKNGDSISDQDIQNFWTDYNRSNPNNPIYYTPHGKEDETHQEEYSNEEDQTQSIQEIIDINPIISDIIRDNSLTSEQLNSIINNNIDLSLKEISEKLNVKPIDILRELSILSGGILTINLDKNSIKISTFDLNEYDISFNLNNEEEIKEKNKLFSFLDQRNNIVYGKNSLDTINVPGVPNLEQIRKCMNQITDDEYDKIFNNLSRIIK